MAGRKKEPEMEQQMVEPDSSTNSTTSNAADQGSRSSNIQRILLRKERVSEIYLNHLFGLLKCILSKCDTFIDSSSNYHGTNVWPN